jgi:hypothetical protein
VPDTIARVWRTELDCDDPIGERHSVPTYPWGKAPMHLLTRRQIRDAGLSPGHPPVAQMLRPRKRQPDRPLRALLYDVHLTVDKRVPSPRPARLDRQGQPGVAHLLDLPTRRRLPHPPHTAVCRRMRRLHNHRRPHPATCCRITEG